MNTLSFFVGSLHDAEDAVQETMLRAWRHFDTFTDRGSGSLRTWVYTIATNTSLDMLKKRSSRQPAVVLYRADEATGSYRAFEIQIITPDDAWLPRQIADVTAFLGQELVISFGFPLQLPQ